MIRVGIKKEAIEVLAGLIKRCTSVLPAHRPRPLEACIALRNTINLYKLHQRHNIERRKYGTWLDVPSKDNFDYDRPYVYLSYEKSQYEPTVRRAVELLREHGVQVWTERERLDGKEESAKTREKGRGLRESTCILACWSDEWMESNDCRGEWNVFAQRINADNKVRVVERNDIFILVAQRWNQILDDEMALLTWGNTIQRKTIHANYNEDGFEEGIRELAGSIKLRFTLPNHEDEPDYVERKIGLVLEPTTDNFDFFMPYLFISYKSEDAKIVEKVASFLRKQGVQVWRDAERIKEGEIWPTQILRGVKHATCFLAFWSDDWMKSNNCIAEWCNFAVRVETSTDPCEKKDCFVLRASRWVGHFLSFFPLFPHFSLSSLLTLCAHLTFLLAPRFSPLRMER
uniref:TIR domain-containing protein n=1 Tax=Palpitomonas bilix TaxID=652834 RepID=A0A7S3DHY4_9EUKA